MKIQDLQNQNRRSLFRRSSLHRSCSTISLSDVEDENMDENFDGFQFSQPDLFNSDLAMQYFLGDSSTDFDL